MTNSSRNCQFTYYYHNSASKNTKTPLCPVLNRAFMLKSAPKTGFAPVGPSSPVPISTLQSQLLPAANHSKLKVLAIAGMRDKR